MRSINGIFVQIKKQWQLFAIATKVLKKLQLKHVVFVYANITCLHISVYSIGSYIMVYISFCNFILSFSMTINQNTCYRAIVCLIENVSN